MIRALTLLLAGVAQAAFAQTTVKGVDFQSEQVGDEPRALVPIVGRWIIAEEQGRKVLKVDGTRWRQGLSEARLADRARLLYGERYAEFLESVRAFAYFPYAVARDISDFREGELQVRFKVLTGRVDQAGGILFDLKPSGEYLVLRANALEDNLVLWRIAKGRRQAVKWVRNTTIDRGRWYDLRVVVRGKQVEGYLDGRRVLEHLLPQPVSGHIGLWTKADSVCLFGAFSVTRSR